MDAAVPEEVWLCTPLPRVPRVAGHGESLAGVFLLFQKMGRWGVDEPLPGAAAPPPELF